MLKRSYLQSKSSGGSDGARETVRPATRCFTLRHYDALSLDEIADMLGLDTGTVKAHLFRAIGKLREELKDLYERKTQLTSGKDTKEEWSV